MITAGNSAENSKRIGTWNSGSNFTPGITGLWNGSPPRHLHSLSLPETTPKHGGTGNGATLFVVSNSLCLETALHFPVADYVSPGAIRDRHGFSHRIASHRLPAWQKSAGTLMRLTAQARVACIPLPKETYESSPKSSHTSRD